jgi:dihydrofolate synthase/folylpolyglutamate synthase
MEKIHYGQTTYNLKRMKWLLFAIDNPENKLRCIHIAGTKGQGSTAIMIAQILASAGYRVGLYTSPHLTDLRERIQIYNGVNKNTISQKDFTNLMSVMVSAIRQNSPTPVRGRYKTSFQPTFFELMTALGFLYFAQKKTDFAVIEVGLGGRLDATNLITPLVSVITRIDFDHTDKLGNTIKKIAYEKTEIIKNGVPLVTFRQKTQADEVIRNKAKTKNALLYITKINKIKLPVFGNHQIENCSLALGVVNVLNQRGYIDINPSIIRNALKEIILPARLELVQRRPDIIIDSAHNPLSIGATVETVRKMKYRNLILVLALSRDKEIARILRILIPVADIVILTKTNHPRLLRPEEFLKYLPLQINKPTRQTDSPVGLVLLESEHSMALNMAQRLAKEEDLILVTGSFYLAGPVRDMF